MNLKFYSYFFLFLCVFDFLSAETINLPPTSPEKKQINFKCPFACGESGSESIEKIEWKFIQCLYQADKISTFMYKNAENFFNMAAEDVDRPFAPIEPMFFHKPENIHSAWYQNMIKRSQTAVALSDHHYCPGISWVVKWKIHHVDNVKDNQGFKYFTRASSDSCDIPAEHYQQLIDDEQNYQARRYKKENYIDEIQWNDIQLTTSILYPTPIDEITYKFDNIIDTYNACTHLETDVFNQINSNFFDISGESPIDKRLRVFYSAFESEIQELIENYDSIFIECAKKHGAPFAIYQNALMNFQQGDYFEALKNLKMLLSKVNLEQLTPNLASQIYHSKGEVEFEMAMYDEAISSLSNAIEKDPKNIEVYFDRAAAYFEAGEFDLSLKDYLKYKYNAEISIIKESEKLYDFSNGIIIGAKNGVGESFAELLPSICSSLQGMTNLQWALISNPIGISKQFASSTIEFCNYLRQCEKAELAQILVPEIYEVIVNWDQLEPAKRGELIGYSLGKYGTDILLPVAALKGAKYAKVYQAIRKAEKLNTLETLAKSQKSKEALTQTAKQWNSHRNEFFAKVQIELDKQTKHTPGAWNFQADKSIFTYNNPEELLRHHAGRGQKVAGVIGEAGYRERVDFGKNIGYFVDRETGEKIPTTIGIIHYSKKGAHIVPAQPK